MTTAALLSLSPLPPTRTYECIIKNELFEVKTSRPRQVSWLADRALASLSAKQSRGGEARLEKTVAWATTTKKRLKSVGLPNSDENVYYFAKRMLRARRKGKENNKTSSSSLSLNCQIWLNHCLKWPYAYLYDIGSQFPAASFHYIQWYYI